MVVRRAGLNRFFDAIIAPAEVLDLPDKTELINMAVRTITF